MESESSKPSWQRTLLAVPEPDRSPEQKEIIDALVALEYAVPIIIRYADEINFKRDIDSPLEDEKLAKIAEIAIDLRAPEKRDLLQACSLLIRVMVGSFFWISPRRLLEPLYC